MEGRWNAEQVLALAPDTSSAKAGSSLAKPGPWTDLGAVGQLVWGHCKGSGKTPYQAIVDLAGPAFKCSCPSRKFPCKHALGLLLLWAGGTVPEVAEPSDFAESWQESRAVRAEKAAKPKGEKDEKAAAKRAEQRAGRVADGLAELDRWLRDQVRTGLAGAASAGYRHVEPVAARMVDAQAAGVAGMLRRTAGIPASGEGWPGRLLDEYAMLRLLAQAYGQLDDLPPDLAAVVRSRVGHSIAREDVLATEPVRDRWLVIAVHDLLDGKVSSRRIWLRGERTGRPALVLVFAAGGGSFATSPDAGLVSGMAVEADLHFYPGRPALRALVGTRHGDTLPDQQPPVPPGGFAELLREWSDALTADPWLTEWPALLEVTPHQVEDGWQLHDRTGTAAPLVEGGIDVWPLIAVSGGRPVVVAGEWTQDGLMPLTVWNAAAAVGL